MLKYENMIAAWKTKEIMKNKPLSNTLFDMAVDRVASKDEAGVTLWTADPYSADAGRDTARIIR